ncbi:hypothetical protein QHH03_31915, partial [Aphanizomenon sp. 202]|nr:hypothetical protein [Aphanizomenon sp. 202]
MAADEMPGFSVAPVEGPLGDKLRKELTSGFYKDFVAIQPGGHIMPSFYPAWHSRYARDRKST